MNSHFTFKDYEKAIKEAGPKATENLLQRAMRDSNISLDDMLNLEDLADKKTGIKKHE